MGNPGSPPDDLARDQAAAQAAQDAQDADGLDGKTKDELLVEAEARGVEVKTSASKADILAALRAEPSPETEG